MRETKVYCDHCGKVLDGMVDYNDTEIDVKSWFKCDLCAECIDELDKFVLKSESEFDSIPVEAAQALKEKAVEKAKAEVAREIFALIFDRLLTSFPAQSFVDAPCSTHNRLFHMLDELKKKYTEGNG